MVEIETRAMRENLISYGLKEQESKHCETMVKELIEQQLYIETNNMKFDRAHRMEVTARKPLPLVVKFHDYQHRELVRQKAQESREILKQSNHDIGIQRQKSVRDARQALYATMQRERANGNAVRMVGGKLYGNGALYKPTQGRREEHLSICVWNVY